MIINTHDNRDHLTLETKLEVVDCFLCEDMTMIINTPFTKKDLNDLELFIEQDISLRCGNKTEAKLLLKDNGLYDLLLPNLIVEDKDKYSYIIHIKNVLKLLLK